jgi:hypothetical protein
MNINWIETCISASIFAVISVIITALLNPVIKLFGKQKLFLYVIVFLLILISLFIFKNKLYNNGSSVNPHPVDIFIVFAGTQDMEVYRNSIILALNDVKKIVKEHWLKNHDEETRPDIRFSTTIYSGYIERPNHYKRVPLEKKNLREIESFLNEHDFSEKNDKPAVFNAIYGTLNEGISEMRKESFRAIILIGDGGDNSPSDTRIHKMKTIIKLLEEHQCYFYAIHTANFDNKTASEKFEMQTKHIKDGLPQGYAEYIHETEPEKVREVIYNKIINLWLDTEKYLL